MNILEAIILLKKCVEIMSEDFFIKRQIESILNKFYFLLKYFVSNLIYKHNYPLQEDKIIKINITDEFFYKVFKLSLVRNNYSDISFDELEKF